MAHISGSTSPKQIVTASGKPRKSGPGRFGIILARLPRHHRSNNALEEYDFSSLATLPIFSVDRFFFSTKLFNLL